MTAESGSAPVGLGGAAIRRRALIRLGISMLAGFPFVLAMMWLASNGWKFYGPGIGAPILPALVFLTELMTGQSFGELARGWDELQGWQRGVLGTSIVLVAGTVLVMIGATVAVLLA